MTGGGSHVQLCLNETVYRKSIMHEYTVNVLGVPNCASHLTLGHWRWCPKWLSQTICWRKAEVGEGFKD